MKLTVFLCRMPILVLVMLVLAACGIPQSLRIAGKSMEPNIKDGDRLRVVAASPSELERGDIVSLQHDGATMVRRVIGLPGDTIEIRDGHVFVDGKSLDEPYGPIPCQYSQPEVSLEAGSYYVLGDNRCESTDSHVWGPIKGDEIKGRVVKP